MPAAFLITSLYSVLLVLAGVYWIFSGVDKFKQVFSIYDYLMSMLLKKIKLPSCPTK